MTVLLSGSSEIDLLEIIYGFPTWIVLFVIQLTGACFYDIPNNILLNI